MTSLPLGGVFQEGRLGCWASAGSALRLGMHLHLVASGRRGRSAVTELFPACFPPCGRGHVLGLAGNTFSSQVLASVNLRAGYTKRMPGVG